MSETPSDQLSTCSNASEGSPPPKDEPSFSVDTMMEVLEILETTYLDLEYEPSGEIARHLDYYSASGQAEPRSDPEIRAWADNEEDWSDDLMEELSAEIDELNAEYVPLMHGLCLAFQAHVANAPQDIGDEDDIEDINERLEALMERINDVRKSQSSGALASDRPAIVGNKAMLQA